MDSMISNVVLLLLAGLAVVWVVDIVRGRQSRPKPQSFELAPPADGQIKVQPLNAAQLQAKVAAEPVEVQPHPVKEPTAPVAEVAPEPVEEPAQVLTPVTPEEFIEPAETVVEVVPAPEAPSVAAPVEEVKVNWLGRIRQGLGKTRSQLTENLVSLFAGAKTIDDDLLEEVETTLLTADIGIEATTQIIGAITQKLARKELKDAEALRLAIMEELEAMLEPCTQPLEITDKAPFVILVVGVNGVGKTTTIGKLAKRYQQQGKSVLLAAGDTFRAAAVEQLQVWGERNQVPVIAQHTGADSASVIFDAIQAAKSRNVDVVIADTAGRLQNKENLMAELEKVVRVIKKHDPEAPHEVLLVLDAGTGQNALSQAQLFRQAVGVSGIALTKLDGTAKGGILFAIAKQHQLPIRYIGVGEGIDDLRPFEAKEFVKALFD